VRRPFSRPFPLDRSFPCISCFFDFSEPLTNSDSEVPFGRDGVIFSESALVTVIFCLIALAAYRITRTERESYLIELEEQDLSRY